MIAYQVKSQGPSARLKLVSKLIAAAALTVLLLRTAWVSDDAFITFRVVNNFLAGYGLRWNVDDRVQVYTDPFFVLLISFCTWISGNVYLATIVLSLLLTLVTFLVITWDTGEIGVIAASLILVLSKGFVDFSVSGMENPLTDLAVALFLLAWWRRREVLTLSLIAALSAVNRMDTLLLFLPALLVLYWREGGRAWKRVLLGWSPFLAWCVFAVFYYGFLLPNTAYAKLSTGIPAGAMAYQGLLYYWNALRLDTVTLLVIAAGLTLAFFRREYAIAVGVLLYLTYIVRVGGDFMSSRFFTAPLVIAVMLIARFWKPRVWVAAVSLAAITAIGFSTPSPTLLSARAGFSLPRTVDWSGIADERAAYYQWTGLLHYRNDPLWPDHPSSKMGHQLKVEGRKLVPFLQIGMFGYQAGPAVHIIDQFGLGDALLARLPKRPGKWRIGHYFRDLPAGYQLTLETGVNQLGDPHLADYYRHLQILIADSVWDRRRLREIYNFNLGPYSKPPV